jgi:hypothetical protein
MTELIKLVQGDTRPQVLITVRNKDGVPVNVAGSTVRMRFANAETMETQSVLLGILLAGLENADGSINNTPPYNTPGVGGRVVFIWSSGSLNVPEGPYIGEVEVTFSDGAIQTVQDFVRFYVREQLGNPAA